MFKLLLNRPCLLIYTIPNFAFDAMLRLTGIERDLVYDQEMYEMIEAGLRGGMTQTTCKKVEANNKYMGIDYDENRRTVIYIYNLFGCKQLIWFKHDT